MRFLIRGHLTRPAYLSSLRFATWEGLPFIAWVSKSPANSEAFRKDSSRRCAYRIVIAGVLCVKSFCRV